jgi:hypothetical protein
MNAIDASVRGLLFGSIMGGVLGLVGYFTGDRATAVRQLRSPQPDYFHKHAALQTIMIKIDGKYRDKNEAAYLGLFKNIDALCCLEDQIREREIEPQYADMIEAEECVTRSLTFLRDLMKSQQQPSRITEMKEFHNTVLDELNERLKQLRILFNQIRHGMDNEPDADAEPVAQTEPTEQQQQQQQVEAAVDTRSQSPKSAPA